jgi:hypothetical protein
MRDTMKKILLATTVLAMSAGFAAADVKVSGSASMGIARDGGTAAVDAVAQAAGSVTTGMITAHNTLSAAGAGAAAALAAGAVTTVATGSTMLAELNDDRAAEVAAYADISAPTLAQQAAHAAALASFDSMIAAASGTAAAAAVAAGDNEFHVYNSGALDFAATVVSDSGVEFGMSTSVSFGNSYSFGDGTDAFASEDGTIGSPTLTVKGAFGKLTFADDGVDNLYSDATAGDFGFDYSAGDLSFSMVSDVDQSNEDEDLAENIGWSASVGYTVSGVALSYATDASSSYSASASYTTGGITGTIGTDKFANADAVNTLTVAYSANGMSAEYSASSDDTWSASAGYSANGLSVDVSTDDEAAWEATTSYDLGGGASLVAGMNHAEEAYAGVDLSF